MKRSDQYKIIKQDNLLAIGQRVKSLRKYLRLTQKEMAAKLDMADSYLSEIENGKSKVGPEFFLKISNEYNVRIEFIFHGEGDMFYSLKRKIDSEEFDFKDNIDSIEKIVWLMENSPLVKNTILGFTTKFILDNEETVRKSIEIYKTKKKDLNPIS